MTEPNPAENTPAQPPETPVPGVAPVAPALHGTPESRGESHGPHGHGEPTRRGINPLLALLGLGLAIGASFLFLRDVVTTVQSSGGEPPAMRIAREELARVNEPQNGWFPAPRDPLYSFSGDTQGWVLQDDLSVPVAFDRGGGAPASKGGSAGRVVMLEELSVVDTKHQAYGHALAVPVAFPDPTTLIRETSRGPEDNYKLQGVRFLSYDVFVPADCPGYVGSLLFLKDKDGLWYQSRSRAALVPGRWTTVTADLRGNSPDITPLGHNGQWDDNQATRVRSVGVTLYGNKDYKGRILIDNLRGWMRYDRFKTVAKNDLESGTVPAARTAEVQQQLAIAQTLSEPPLKVVNFRTEPPAPPGEDASPASVPKFNIFTVRFELNRQVDNPFDPERADVTCTVTAPSGATTEHIGFWYQDYDRGDSFKGETLNPIGRPEWRVRLTPREEGEHKYTVKIRVKTQDNAPEELTLPTRSFVALPSEDPGFIRIAKNDPRFFEFENGQFYYPVGHNISTPVDIRCWREIFREEPPAGRGLPMYANYFDKMSRNGANVCEVWMASWWLGIEWTSLWPNFYGAGRYSLQNAWKLDYLLEMARQHNIYIHVVLDNHGKFSAWCDWEWELNPYNRSNPYDNGTAENAEHFFSDEVSRKRHRNKLRYIAARWGADTTVLGWELVSEYDLVGGQHQSDRAARSRFHRSPVLKKWAIEMATHMKQCDPYGHPVTNHYATDYNIVDADLMRNPVFDYVVTDVYRPISRRYAESARLNHTEFILPQLHAQNATKPFWITEYGGDFNAGPIDSLHADIHCGLWSTWMTDGAGTPLFWWYDVIDRLDIYSYYGAFAKYIAGEDRRGIKGVHESLAITAGNDQARLLGQVYRWEGGAYAWVYNDQAMFRMPPPAARLSFANVEAQLPALAPGDYRIEFWDCYTGQIVHSEVQKMEGQPVRLKFPQFVNNMAVKVKPASEGSKISGSAPRVQQVTSAPAAAKPAPLPASKERRKPRFIAPPADQQQ